MLTGSKVTSPTVLYLNYYSKKRITLTACFSPYSEMLTGSKVTSPTVLYPTTFSRTSSAVSWIKRKNKYKILKICSSKSKFPLSPKSTIKTVPNILATDLSYILPRMSIMSKIRILIYTLDIYDLQTRTA